MQVADIERACVETARLLESGKVPPDTAILCTKCYDSMPHDEPYVDVVEPFLRKVPCIHKPTMDVTYNPAFFRWLQQQVRLLDGILHQSYALCFGRIEMSRFARAKIEHAD